MWSTAPFRANINSEQVYVADETGVQGRFQHAVGHIVGTRRNYDNTPDVTIVSQNIPTHLQR
ncbi:hypothetical protein N7491_010664 [Penicillium cf. griseofulvum]|uniref:Uncharacterized protein n=1 Tax=Penicillium cf. griseofulvum TaxID=2972120 RepID=A0A9W9N0D2_9EURO|nr:hypothetical protein N7472_000991 [Penicillium cf. griseofulvum]KAJ5422219.1 hypothetical protein N7491_010664 [Penicillium cf. griseofulvum]KAJ5428403.1 hypothetical protein N7445_009857 [Penicillium cf. griseofulvum]